MFISRSQPCNQDVKWTDCHPLVYPRVPSCCSFNEWISEVSTFLCYWDSSEFLGAPLRLCWMSVFGKIITFQLHAFKEHLGFMAKRQAYPRPLTWIHLTTWLSECLSPSESSRMPGSVGTWTPPQQASRVLSQWSPVPQSSGPQIFTEIQLAPQVILPPCLA